MWFFMILSYVMVALSGIGLLMVGINHYFDFWAQNHITLDLLVSIVFIAGQTLVMFFFVGTGVNIREYLEANPSLGKDLYKKMFAIKRKLYPPTMMVTVLFMVMVIIDGAFFIGKVSEWWFHILYILTLYYFFKATIIQHKSFKESTDIVLKMTGADNTDS
ncbi:MAG: hypothetical protein HN927_02840 [Candidatus Marinimicrobia bacterium]|jgi:hypothetical protein|nr:hypothetical protein [Candidatus Neomarinimicrobiota bacterium]MBT4064631.1 hypothetical protein [Candidatus Neomarinimicrobiota bacterium]MBT4453597.1 hypothetical protein [Candidatus Neomarinimicrobiota bacterium]MBT4735869.1 hypothetical protein [Candidatus Neomarinimicrobiota bacterium]MBT6390148.1 hypothetical protein [Candidatus Neomarinimicrobiota bacterium]